MATAPSLRSGGARVYSQSGDIDQLLEDAWVPNDHGGRRDEQRSDSFQRQADPSATEKERALMAQLADAQRQLRELSRMRWGGGDGGSQTSSRDGYGGDRLNRAGGANPALGDYSYPRDSSWSDSRGSSIDSRSPAANSGRESPEPLYVNTEMARAPAPPPRTSQPLQSRGSLPQLPYNSAAAQFAAPALAAPASVAKMASGMMPGHSHHQRSSEKASSSKHEESVEVKESVSVFQVYPPVAGASGGVPNHQPPSRAPSAAAPLEGRRLYGVPTQDGGAGPGRVFHFPPQGQAPPSTEAWHSVGDGSSASSRGGHTRAAAASSMHQQMSSSSRQTEQYHSHGQNPPAPIPTPQATASYRGSEAVSSREWGDSSVAHKSQHKQQQAYRSESAHISGNSHSISHQSQEASSSAEHQSQGVSDVYSETTSLRPIGPGIQTLRSHTALHKLRQTNSGFHIDNNRIRTLNLSTPHLDNAPTGTNFRSDQQLAAAPLQHGGVGPLRGSSPHVAASGAPVQLLPMAFMVAMPTTAVSLQQLNMFNGTAGLSMSAYPALTATSAHQQQHLMLTQQSQQHHQSQSQRQQQQLQQQLQQQQRTQQLSMHSSRSIARSQQIASGSSSARASSIGGGFRVSSASAAPVASSLMPRVVVDTASSSEGSSSTIHADFEAGEKPYMELGDLRQVQASGASISSSTAARRSQSSSGTAHAELLRSTRTASLRAGGIKSGGRLPSADRDDTVFTNATYASATLQASALEPRTSFMQASSSSHHHQQQHSQQQQQQQQQHLQVHGFHEQSSRANFSSGGGGGGWASSPGSVTPTRRYSGHSSAGGFDFDPPSPGGMLKFVNDNSQLWYLPNISRDEAIAYLRPLPPGRFIVRDSTSFQGAYGLAVKVAEVPLGATAAAGEGGADELVRHFLIEQTSKGVRIRGCANEPVFASLAALIYQHTVMPLALPCKLALPDATDLPDATTDMAAAAAAGGAVDPRVILEHGAACNVLYLGATDIESLTGSGGLARAVDALLRNRDRLRSCVCQLKVAKDGISLTDTARRQFFRKHYPTACVLYCGMDPALRSFDSSETNARGLSRSKIFGFVARKNPGSQENTAVIMCEIEEHQPAEAVVKFVCKYLIGSR